MRFPLWLSQSSLEPAAHCEEGTASSVPSLLTACSPLLAGVLAFVLTETPRCWGFQGCTVLKEKQLQSLWRLGERREKFYVAGTAKAGTARVVGIQ